MGRTRFARRGGVRIAYETRFRRWRRRPRLVLVQGLGFDRSGWDPVLAGLGRHLDLVLIDNRGTGRSGDFTGGVTVADLAGDVVAVFDAAGISHAHVLGASLGGMVAQEVAINHPARVDRLVLVCTTPGWPYAYPMPSQSTRLMIATRSLPRETALRRNVENALSAETVAQRPELVERLVRHQQARPIDPAAWTALATAGARFSGNLRQQRIRARTLVLHGDADTVVDPRNSALLAGRIPRAERVCFPGLGHLCFWEDPDAFVHAVVDFLGAAEEPA